MALRVGIPRAMGYYYLYPFFRTLLIELGAEPVLSSPTTRKTLERMDACPTDEPCLAVKLHFSHADSLASRPDIDFLFLPIIARVEKSWCCPKFIGVADMTRHGLRLPSERVLSPVIEYTDNDRELCTSLRLMAEQLGVHKAGRLRLAIKRAREEQQRVLDLCTLYHITLPEAYRLAESNMPCVSPGNLAGPAIAVIGHPYIIYEVVSQGMIDRLRQYGPVITAEMVAQDDITRAMTTIDEGPRLWPFEALLLGAALHVLRQHQVDRLILVGSFECGPESIIECYVEEEARRQGIPLMVLALDEHSGEAGLMTRLEAFMDTEKCAQTAPGAFPEPGPLLPHDEIVMGIPSMGYLDIAIRNFVESFGVRTITTPRTTKTCIDLGREIAPEFVCFPFTATLGQMRYMLDHGANTLLMVGGKGYCRLGWYAQVQERLLRNLGYDFELLTVESPLPLRTKWVTFRDILKRISDHAPWHRIVSRLYTCYQQLALLDRMEAQTMHLRAFEREQGTANRLFDRYLQRMAQVDSLAEIHRLEKDFFDEVAGIDVEDTHPLRIRIAGEIWVVLEQAATHDIERWLGRYARPRIWIDRENSASSWFNLHVLRLPSALQREQQVIEAARPWLSRKVGGHGQLTIGQTVLAPAEGMDGVLHIFPFTCMPEIIAQNILVRVTEELDIPILTYIVSEQTGEAGMETRLESFIDLLEERRFAGHRLPAAV